MMKYIIPLMLAHLFAQGQDCTKIEKTVDKFKGDITFRSPLLQPVSFTKYIAGSDTSLYMRLSATGYTVAYGKGVYVLLSNGGKIVRESETIDVDVEDNGYGYTAFIALTKSEIRLLRDNEITDFKLYIFDEVVKPANALKYKDYLKCLLDAK